MPPQPMSSPHPEYSLWCLFEISHAKELDQPFELIVSEGPLANSNIETLEVIAKKLVTVRAFKTEISLSYP